MPVPAIRTLFVALLLVATGCTASREASVTEETTPDTPVVVADTEATSSPDEGVPAPETSPGPLATYGSAPEQWLGLDEERDGVRGISLHRAYEALSDRQPQRAVVVAVIDSGVDITHDDLDGRIWTNSREIAGNGLDDDGNGYADDLHGWSFLGNADGENVQHERLELTREVARLREQFRGIDLDALSPTDRADYDRFQTLEADLQQQLAETKHELSQYEQMLAQTEQVELVTQQAREILRSTTGSDTITDADLQPGFLDSPQVEQAKNVLRYLRSNGITDEQITEERELIAEITRQTRNRLKYHLNTEFDPRALVGDDPDDVTERFYGNADVTGPYAAHGTSVAGVIAARRDNAFGFDGVVSDSVFIMSVRAVPSGDERDKDIANAIRYAVDNGAHVVNMSFGKDVSPDKEVVDEAVRYAAERGVLLVHASGNDSEDIDTAPNFPEPTFIGGERANNWLEVGATQWDATGFAASFSNYGQQTVDLFAPGQEIDVLDLNDGTDRADGTSVAAPVVSGVAALLLSYFPDLSPLDVRTILLDSATPYRGTNARRPGNGEPVDFGTLSITGGVVNALRAVELAASQTGS